MLEVEEYVADNLVIDGTSSPVAKVPPVPPAALLIMVVPPTRISELSAIQNKQYLKWQISANILETIENLKKSKSP